jgi:RNA polymerase subunit RPABC4/transcription elongation factor Spt4
MFCKKCGTRINDGAKFCPACGQTVPAATAEPAAEQAVESRCTSCGTALKKDAQFCPNCGRTVQAAQKEPARGEARPENLVSGEDGKTAEAARESLDAKNNCLNCGKPIEENWQLCPYCGKEIVRDIVCSNCGKKLEKDWIVCPFCKIPVQNETVQ